MEGPHPTVPNVKMADALAIIYPIINFNIKS